MKKNYIYKSLVGIGKIAYKGFRVIFPSRNTKMVRKLMKEAQFIDSLSKEYAQMTDEQLRAKTQEFKDQLASGKTLDDILPHAFATVREASYRLRGEKHYLVQLMGGIVLHRGMIAEMGTGEGKTLVATLPVYLNALNGKGVHVITVNDYLAKRDSAAMGAVYEFLGMTVGCVVHGMSHSLKHAAYQADITYGTNHEFVFDYLRDNMVKDVSEMVQRPFAFCTIDEVDNILIDEARTPCIISGESVESSELCKYADYIVKQLVDDDYEKDEKSRNAYFTEKGLEHLEQILYSEGVLSENETIFDEQYVLLVHHLNQSLKAVVMYQEGVQYIVRDGEVFIVDEFTGRIMEGRRYSDGLHQAIEAKEGVDIQKENQTLATITYQKFFELYPKKAGMTGTAMTEAEELASIYKLNVVAIPSNRKSQKTLLDDRIYRTFAEKLDAIIQIVEDCRARKQPILIGTVSVEKSEIFSHALKAKNIPHQVLNAKNHAYEAQIIAQAGVPGAVTIATNMAGRGTDIKLGGSLEHMLKAANINAPGVHDTNEDIEGSMGSLEHDHSMNTHSMNTHSINTHSINTHSIDSDHSSDKSMQDKNIEALKAHIAEQAEIAKQAGGLFVLGTERHESRRIDNQLVGRCGRQGDKGTALFLLSIEDPLMQIFGGQTLQKWLPKMEYGEVIEHPLVTRAMSKAQKRVEAYHFDARKNVLRYDSTINDQSKIIYKERMEFMTYSNVLSIVENLIDSVVIDVIARYGNSIKEGEYEHFIQECHKTLNVDVNREQFQNQGDIAEVFKQIVKDKLEEQKTLLGMEYLEMVCKDVCLSTLDMLWRQHLTNMENLRLGIGLRSYGQKDPLNEFKREAFSAFEDMMHNFRNTVVSCVMHHKLVQEERFNLNDEELNHMQSHIQSSQQSEMDIDLNTLPLE